MDRAAAFLTYRKNLADKIGSNNLSEQTFQDIILGLAGSILESKIVNETEKNGETPDKGTVELLQNSKVYENCGIIIHAAIVSDFSYAKKMLQKKAKAESNGNRPDGPPNLSVVKH